MANPFQNEATIARSRRRPQCTRIAVERNSRVGRPPQRLLVTDTAKGEPRTRPLGLVSVRIPSSAPCQRIGDELELHGICNDLIQADDTLRLLSCNGCVSSSRKNTIAPERVVGLDQIVADAVKLKFIADPLTPAQIKEFVQIPTPQ